MTRNKYLSLALGLFMAISCGLAYRSLGGTFGAWLQASGCLLGLIWTGISIYELLRKQPKPSR